jgi:hypothetical protein
MVNVDRLCRFLAAIDAAVAGDRTRLARFVCDHETLTVAEKRKLADFIEGKLDRKRGRPPTKIWQKGNPLKQVAAFEVEELKAELRKNGLRYGIHQPVTELVASKHGFTTDELLNYQRRSKRPRKKAKQSPAQ